MWWRFHSLRVRVCVLCEYSLIMLDNKLGTGILWTFPSQKLWLEEEEVAFAKFLKWIQTIKNDCRAVELSRFIRRDLAINESNESAILTVLDFHQDLKMQYFNSNTVSTHRTGMPNHERTPAFPHKWNHLTTTADHDLWTYTHTIQQLVSYNTHIYTPTTVILHTYILCTYETIDGGIFTL